MREDCPLFPLLFNIVLEFLAKAIRQEQEITRIQIRKEEVKLPLFADDMRPQKLQEIRNFFGKVAGYKISIKNQ
jgi:hypothetical protein